MFIDLYEISKYWWFKVKVWGEIFFFFMGINSLSVYTSVLRPHSVLYLNYVAFMLFHRNMESACHKNNKGFRYVKDTQCNPNLWKLLLHEKGAKHKAILI